jgi:hypothetical protein
MGGLRTGASCARHIGFTTPKEDTMNQTLENPATGNKSGLRISIDTLAWGSLMAAMFLTLAAGVIQVRSVNAQAVEQAQSAISAQKTRPSQ